MRWKGLRQSSNVEDRRGKGGRMAAGVGGGGLLIVVIAVVARLFDVDPALIQQGQQMVQQMQQNAPAEAGEGVDDEARAFVGAVLGSTEDVWNQLFAEQVRGERYQEPELILFSGQVRSGCGAASAAMGPFYCPADQRVYIDPAFFNDLARRHKAPGDFAQAYVIAHEVAHHVQNLLGFNREVNRVRQSGDELASNRMSVRLELQADYLAGVWAHYARNQYNLLEPGDMEEAIQAANQIGDDTLQRQAGQYVNPDRFTHGTSEQRAYWFRQGLESGRLAEAQQLFQLNYDRL